MAMKVVVFFCVLLIATAEQVHSRSSKPQKQGRRGRIIGGSEAEPHEFPHMVSLDRDPTPTHFCGGAIIDKNWVVTAGHCIGLAPRGRTFRIRAGKHSLSTVESTEQVINVEKYFIHKDYPGGTVVAGSDIALLKLEKPLVFNKYVQPIALPRKNADATGKAIFSGWGTTEDHRNPDNLRKAEFSIIDLDTCQKADIASSSPPTAVTNTNLCTGSLPDGPFACPGDSGSPLIQQRGKNTVLVGIFSWLANPCGKRGAPSVFTKVSLFRDWIAEIIAENSL